MATNFEHFIGGFAGGIASTLVCHPLDLLKIRFSGSFLSSFRRFNPLPSWMNLKCSAVVHSMKTDANRVIWRQMKGLKMVNQRWKVNDEGVQRRRCACRPATRRLCSGEAQRGVHGLPLRTASYVFLSFVKVFFVNWLLAHWLLLKDGD